MCDRGVSFNSIRLSKPTKAFSSCAERYACVEDNAKAEFTCKTCKSDQCCPCNEAIHKSANSRNHEIVPISVDLNRLCTDSSSCGNYGQVLCVSCDDIKYCSVCFRKSHPIRTQKAKHLVEEIKEKDTSMYLSTEVVNNCDILELDLQEVDSFQSCLPVNISENSRLKVNNPSLPDVMADTLSSTASESFFLIDSSEELKVYNEIAA